MITPRFLLCGFASLGLLGPLPAFGQSPVAATSSVATPASTPPGGGSWAGGSDDCTTPTDISGTGSFAFDNTIASTGTTAQNETLCGSSGIDDDVWFLWTANADGVAVVDTCGQTTVDTKIAVFAAGGCPADGSALACNDNVCGFQSSTAWTASGGEQYLIQIGSSPGMPGGIGSFEIENAPPPGTVADYAAGTAGNPPIAPAPDTQGWTEVDASAGLLPTTDVSPDGGTGLNAWQIDDTMTAPNMQLFYEFAVGPEGVARSRHLGWSYEMKMRMLVGTLETIFFEYSTGVTADHERYKMWFKVIGSDVRVRVQGGPTYLLANGFDGNYHSFKIVKPPGQQNVDAQFFYDGLAVGPFPAWTGDAVSAPGAVWWGAGSFANTGAANWNAVTFIVGGPAVGSAYCFGDGSGSACPCGNESLSLEGCQNSTGNGARLDAEGSSSVSADDLGFACDGLLPGQPALLFVGNNAVNNGDGGAFGDGLRCAGQGVVRLGVRVPDSNGVAEWGPGLAGSGGWTSGDVRYFQVWYRDPQGSPCGTSFNLSNGFEVTLTP